MKINKLISCAKENNFFSIKNSGLIFKKDEVNEKDLEGNTALYYAAKNGNKELCLFLLSCGANPNTQCQNNFTPTH